MFGIIYLFLIGKSKVVQLAFYHYFLSDSFAC